MRHGPPLWLWQWPCVKITGITTRSKGEIWTHLPGPVGRAPLRRGAEETCRLLRCYVAVAAGLPPEILAESKSTHISGHYLALNYQKSHINLL